jgi:hypothetical protein
MRKWKRKRKGEACSLRAPHIFVPGWSRSLDFWERREDEEKEAEEERSERVCFVVCPSPLSFDQALPSVFYM